MLYFSRFYFSLYIGNGARNVKYSCIPQIIFDEAKPLVLHLLHFLYASVDGTPSYISDKQSIYRVLDFGPACNNNE